MKVKIIPTSQRAKNRIHEHGEIMELIEDHPGKFLVRSLKKTWNKNTDFWMGWFNRDKEATIVAVNEQ